MKLKEEKVNQNQTGLVSGKGAFRQQTGTKTSCSFFHFAQMQDGPRATSQLRKGVPAAPPHPLVFLCCPKGVGARKTLCLSHIWKNEALTALEGRQKLRVRLTLPPVPLKL